MSSVRWLVLDAMGVIYRARDDVAERESPSFRIGHMGHVDDNHLLEVLAAVEAVLVSTGRSLAGSGLSVAEAALRRLNREER